MKIEKINDRQIRCTLTREDLTSRQIKLSELAYGSEKARALFQDMMQMAAQRCGFEADNTPLMIEAIPISIDSVLLIVTKVEDPEELDTRFSRFSPDNSENRDEFSPSTLMEHIEGADDILDLISKITGGKIAASGNASSAKKAAEAAAGKTVQDADEASLQKLSRLYRFFSLNEVIRAAASAGEHEGILSRLYKKAADGQYYLLVQKGDGLPARFNCVCNILSEFGLACKYEEGMEVWMEEHYETILASQALQTLQQLS